MYGKSLQAIPKSYLGRIKKNARQLSAVDFLLMTREFNGELQEYVGKRVGWSRSWVCRLERGDGKVTFKNIDLVCKAYNLTKEEIKKLLSLLLSKKIKRAISMK